MVETVFRISFFFFFFFLKFKIQLLVYVNPRGTVMKVLLFVFARAMVDLSTPMFLLDIKNKRGSIITLLLNLGEL